MTQVVTTRAIVVHFLLVSGACVLGYLGIRGSLTVMVFSILISRMQSLAHQGVAILATAVLVLLMYYLRGPIFDPSADVPRSFYAYGWLLFATLIVVTLWSRRRNSRRGNA
jgi:hypothetical protein